MSLPFMQTLLAGDIAAAEQEIGATIPPDLAEQLDHFLQFRIADLTVDPSAQPWLGRAIVRTDPDGSRRVIGTCGFHSAPDDSCRVEIGYRVEAAERRKGVATEVVRALLDWAVVEHGVNRFRASVAPGNLPSLAVVAKFGFRQVGVQMDDIDGEELVFELDDWAATA